MIEILREKVVLHLGNGAFPISTICVFQYLVLFVIIEKTCEIAISPLDGMTMGLVSGDNALACLFLSSGLG